MSVPYRKFLIYSRLVDMVQAERVTSWIHAVRAGMATRGSVRPVLNQLKALKLSAMGMLRAKPRMRPQAGAVAPDKRSQVMAKSPALALWLSDPFLASHMEIVDSPPSPQKDSDR